MQLPPSPILLISTDFDGTLVEHGNPAPFAPLLMQVFQALQDRGVRWAINTGRTLDLIVEGLESFAVTVRPDFILASEREIYRPAPGGGWEDYGEWNERCAQVHRELFEDAQPLFAEVLEFVGSKTQARTLYDSRAIARGAAPRLEGLISSSEEEMDLIADFLETLRARLPQFSYQRNTIYLRFCHGAYDKGVALAELGRLIGVPAQATFAVGDHHNDIPMLDGRYAGHVACPSNSVEAVKQVVREAGGYVAGTPYSAGVIEALRFFCGDLPW